MKKPISHNALNTLAVLMLLLPAFLLLPGPSALAQQPMLQEEMLPIEPPDRSGGPDGLEITEFIFNETITKLGADFYHYFFQNWSNPSGVEGLSIYVEERPVPGMGGIVSLRIEDQIVYQGMLRPNNQQIRDAADQAVERAQGYLINYELMQQQLESDDKSGSGIF